MWVNKEIDELTAREFYAMEKLRIDTFVLEQKRNYHELDEIDLVAHHLAYLEEGQCLAYARIFEKADTIHFGRVATALSARGKGYGGQLLKEILSFCDNKWPNRLIEIEAQEQVVGLYEKFGFESVGELFVLEGTPHQKMVRKPGVR
ncbi:GNAT family N-acetyltransferase [Fructobacillus papyrifericola]|uniref:GNAT family N-acetyltransferase n=1 Tax=Fructobacillus papyrifericola TaxID=2713172 RepID=A0ABS5QS81_9LACO|nr:GNAT family N-acetyltransferase [Fructobacillus papyrifericola]MBS9336064.1 GNAT family N-acetyltransferase [Fructobacillus papyrifericola]